MSTRLLVRGRDVVTVDSRGIQRSLHPLPPRYREDSLLQYHVHSPRGATPASSIS